MNAVAMATGAGWRELLETPVRPCGVEVPQVRGKDAVQMPLVDDQQPIEQFAAETSDHSLANRVRTRSLRRAEDDLDALGGEHRVERTSEPGVSFPQRERQRAETLTEVHQQVACRLCSPCAGRVGGGRLPHPGRVL